MNRKAAASFGVLFLVLCFMLGGCENITPGNSDTDQNSTNTNALPDIHLGDISFTADTA